VNGVNQGLIELKSLDALAKTEHFPYLNELVMSSSMMPSPTSSLSRTSSEASTMRRSMSDSGASRVDSGNLGASPAEEDEWEIIGDSLVEGLDERYPEEYIEVKDNLMKMGYHERQADEAVKAVGGDLDLALDYLGCPRSRDSAVKASWSQVSKQAVAYEGPSLGQALKTNWLNPSIPCAAPRKQAPPIQRSRTPVYTSVLASETMSGVALRCNVPLTLFLRENNLKRGTEVYEGQRLLVPQVGQASEAPSNS